MKVLGASSGQELEVDTTSKAARVTLYDTTGTPAGLDVVASGNLTALNTTVPIATKGTGTAIVEITGTWSGIITFEGSNNNFTTVQAVTAIFLGGIQTNAATTTTNGYFSVVVAGFAKMQARMSTYTSGTAAVLINASAAERIVVPLQGNPNNHQVLATLNTGSAIVGKVGIDQTTQGTTNKVAISDALGNATNSAGNGFLKVTDEPHQIFYDSFDASLDTVNYWTSTQGSSGVAASVSLGVLSMGTGTAANGYSKLNSIPTFKPTIPGWVVFSDAIALPDGAAPIANSYRYWGTGTTPATPTVAAPVTDGFGFELNTDGKLRAVVYAGGVELPMHKNNLGNICDCGD